ncbi:MAG: hypothetical protein JNN20_08440, partial [Betaproteobacteria bacterium]|nr:hypothetical protein [Betaproteobacteria bacterium]
MNARDLILPQSRESLERLEILDTLPEGSFDDLARRATEVFDTAMAGISFFDVPATPSQPWREWFKARVGFPAQSLPRHESF